MVAVIIMGFLALTAVFVIATTIRLTMNTRRKEIEIMKLVGATDWFIRWPFLIEGLFLGLIGAIVAVGALSGSYLILVNNLKTALAFIPLISDPRTLLHVFAGLLVTGLFLGTTGTLLSIYKFLDI
jgi:cell division transport system permease protein